jgi:hypothetical protein
MKPRLFLVSFPAPITRDPDTFVPEQNGEAFVQAADIPDAFHRFAQAHPNSPPTGVREAGPVAQNVLRKLLNKRSLLS